MVPSCVAAGLTWASGAFQAEFVGNPDEAAHYVTGLMVRDYVAAGLPRGPLRFAENYYLHYPKVALGRWPPGFYLLQTAWTMVFSPSRLSILLSMAALAYGKFLDQPRWREAIVFSVLAVLAIMTHGKTLALALLPGFAILIGRRLDLLRRACFWFPALPVLVICGPWYMVGGQGSAAPAPGGGQRPVGRDDGADPERVGVPFGSAGGRRVPLSVNRCPGRGGAGRSGAPATSCCGPPRCWPAALGPLASTACAMPAPARWRTTWRASRSSWWRWTPMKAVLGLRIAGS